ncbi:MAG: tetratricopeptide repeat protein [Clostridia bacterium]|nr:tetratricopeptide repeat protein [Clostridia bacterium]
MSLLVSVVIAVILVLALGYAAPYLPFNQLLGGSFYQVVSILLAIGVSAVLNLPMLYMMSANSAYKKGDRKAAVEKYKKAYKTKRLTADMEIYCGYILLKEGDKAASEEIFEAVSKKKLNSYQKDSLDTNKAILLWKKGQLDDAVALLNAVWERSPSVTAAGTLGALMLVKARETGDYEKALRFCEQTNEQYTYEKTILANLGEAYYCTGKNEEALRVFGELMDCGCGAPAPYYYYALALLKEGRQEEAEEMLNMAMRQRFSALSTVPKKVVKAKLDEIAEE